jgi:hypothetical protein
MASSRERPKLLTACDGAKPKSQCLEIQIQTLAHRSLAILFEQYLAQSRSPRELRKEQRIAARPLLELAHEPYAMCETACQGVTLMEFNRRLSRLVTGSAALVLILTACHGASSGTPSYLPTGSSGISTQQQLDRGIAPAGEERGEMFSSCGHHVRIILAGIVTCRFHEVGDRDAAFTLKNHTQV